MEPLMATATFGSVHPSIQLPCGARLRSFVRSFALRFACGFPPSLPPSLPPSSAVANVNVVNTRRACSACVHVRVRVSRLRPSSPSSTVALAAAVAAAAAFGRGGSVLQMAKRVGPPTRALFRRYPRPRPPCRRGRIRSTVAAGQQWGPCCIPSVGVILI